MTTPQTIWLKFVEFATRYSASADARKPHAVSIAVGWPQHEWGWDVLRPFRRAHAALDEIDRVLSTGSGGPHGEDRASIGMIIISPCVETHGGGRWMTDRILKGRRDRKLVLNSTRAAVRHYLGLVLRAVVYQCHRLVAASEADAASPVASLLEGRDGRFVRADAPLPDGKLRAVLAASGIPVYGTVLIMSHGCELPAVVPGRFGIYGLASHVAG